jgi:hypothetical protein
LFSKRILKLNQKPTINNINTSGTFKQAPHPINNISFKNSSTGLLQKGAQARDKNVPTSSNKLSSGNNNSDFESSEESSDSEIDNNNLLITKDNNLTREISKTLIDQTEKTPVSIFSPITGFLDQNSTKPDQFSLNNFDLKSKDISKKFSNLLKLEDNNVK